MYGVVGEGDMTVISNFSGERLRDSVDPAQPEPTMRTC